MTGTSTLGSDEARGRLASLHALGALEPEVDGEISVAVSLAERISSGRCQVWLRGRTGEVGLVMVAGSGDPLSSEGVDHSRGPRVCLEPICVYGIEVGEVRAEGISPSNVRDIVQEVQSVLENRLERARRDERGHPVGVVVVGPDLNIVWASPEADRFEVVGGLVPGRPILDLVNGAELEASASMLRRGIGGRGRTSVIPVSLMLEPGESVSFDVMGDNRIGDPEVDALTFVLRRANREESELTLLGDQMWALNRMAAGEPLGEVLRRVLDMIEHRDPFSAACVMEPDQTGTALHPLLAPHLPVPLIGLLRGLPIGPDHPAGGASFGLDVGQYTPDVSREPTFAPFAEVLDQFDIKACWSIPIRSLASDAPLGTVDVYRTLAGNPTEVDGRVMVMASRLAGLAMDHAAREADLRFRATHDPLTELGNRVLFAERLAEAAADGHVGVLFIDLDRFKLVNDTLGHDFGDAVLHAVARRIEESVEDPVVVARFGGDEFTVLVPDVTRPEQLTAVAQRLLDAIARPLQVRGQRVVLGASIGAALAEEPPPDPQSLIRDADTALYHAKDLGRGRVEVFDDRLLAAGAERVRVEQVLRDALENGRMDVHFQPTVRISDGSVSGAEALARCHTSEGEDLPPAVFIPVAEEVGLIPEVFEFVLSRACEAAAAWNVGRDKPFVVWVNLSPRQLGTKSVIERITRVVSASPAEPWMLGFEVTEGGILPDPVEAADFLGRIAALGPRIAIDDFGTGYSSLGYLQGLPVDTVKLDRSFVVRAGDDRRSRAIVGSVVDLTRAMDLACVAEGVETEAQLAVLSDLGCELVQGFIYSRPMPVEELTAWLSQR